MGFFTFKSEKRNALLWEELQTEDQVMDAVERSHNHPILFFKHSTRCSISSMALSRFENNWKDNDTQTELLFIDLLNFRAISNHISNITKVEHQSPQVIVLKNGEVIYTASHMSIDTSEIQKTIQSLKQ